METFKVASDKENSESKYHIFGRIGEISTNIKDLKDAGVPNTLPFNSFICPVENTDGSWKMTGGY